MTLNATVTVLFTDLVDATELIDRLGEEGAQALRREHFQSVRDAVTSHGGQEVKSVGDGLMIVFQSAVDAVGCSVAIEQAVDRHNRRNPGSRFDVRIGVNVGEPTREGDDYFGLPVVVAKRLCDSADPAQILVSDVVRALVGPRAHHRFRPLEPRELKGVGVTAVYEVAWEPVRPANVPLPAALVPPVDAVFVGRERELDRLHAAWKEATTGTRRAVLIGGEPGVGKTRLAAEFAEHVSGDGVVLYGRCDEDLGMPYQPFAEVLRAAVASHTDEDLAERVGRNAASLARLVPELRDRLGDIPAQTAGDAEAERYLLFEAVSEFLGAASRDQPMLVVVDDLHWASKPTLVMLRHLLRSTVSTHALIVGTFRDTELDRAPLLAETLAELRRDADVERISLSGLDRASVAAFVAASGYGGGTDPGDLAEAVHAGTEGNPFVVGEVLRHLKERGDGPEGAEGLGLPPGVKDVIISRLARLSPAANQLLTLGSVVGARFELTVLERVGDLSADELLDALDEAVRARVLVELPTVGQYTFAHALIRQVLVGELSASRRARLHWRITGALAALPDAANRVEELAFHSAAAGPVGDVAAAAGYALAASRRALERLSYEPAVELASRGLDALGDADAGTARAELLLALAEARSFTGDVKGMKAAAEEAATAARQASWAVGLARAAALYGRWIELGMRDDDAERLCQEALAGLDDSELMWRARVLTTLANYRVHGESLGAAVTDLAEESLALARQAGDAESIEWALYLRAVAGVSTGDVEGRLALAEELVALSQGRRDAKAELDALTTRGSARLEAGDIEGFDADTAALSALGERLHWWAAHFWAGNFSITRALLSGDFAYAERTAEEQFALGAQDANAFNAYATQLFAARRQTGRLAEMEPLISDAVGANPNLIAFRAGLALTRVEMGKADAARAEVDALAADNFAVVPQDVGYTSCLALLTETVGALGAAEYAPALADRLQPHAGHFIVGGVGIACFGAADRYLAILAALRGSDDEADALFQRAAALEDGAHAAAELARTRYWWGRFRDRADLLEAAAATGGQLGMAALVRHAEEARAALG
jgi:class 3 adenylate cyclase